MNATQRTLIDQLVADRQYFVNYVNHLIGNRDLRPWAEDVVQDAYVKALVHIDQFQEGNLRGWFFTIVRNCMYSRNRRSKFEVRIPGISEDFNEWAVQLSMDERGFNQVLVEQSLDKLNGIGSNENNREVFRLWLLGMEYEEIAVHMGTPCGTVKSRLNRFREALEQELI